MITYGETGDGLCVWVYRCMGMDQNLRPSGLHIFGRFFSII